MALRKVNEQNMMNVFPEDNELSQLNKEAEEVIKSKEKNINDVIEEQKSKQLDNTDNGLNLIHTILSTGIGENLSNFGGPSKQIKTEISDSVWGQVNIKEKSKVTIEKEDIITAMIKQEEERAQKRKADKERVQSLPSNSSEVVFSNSDNENNFKFLSTSNTISLFDTESFERLPEKTAGEELSDDVNKKQNQEDNSWRDGKGALSSKHLFNKLFDNLSESQ